MNQREFIKNAFKIKTDCFAFHKDLYGCKALTDLYCMRGKCAFYKTMKERCDGCKKANKGRENCQECMRKGLK